MTSTEKIAYLPRMGTTVDGSVVVASGLVAGAPCVRLADGRRIVGMSVYYL